MKTERSHRQRCHAMVFSATRPSLVRGNPAAFQKREVAYKTGLWRWCSRSLYHPPSCFSILLSTCAHFSRMRQVSRTLSIHCCRQSPVYPLSVVISGKHASLEAGWSLTQGVRRHTFAQWHSPKARRYVMLFLWRKTQKRMLWLSDVCIGAEYLRTNPWIS